MEKLYFTEKLLEKLEKMKRSSVSILEAPAGYGKTVAVHHIFNELEDQVYWHTAVESMPDTSFQWFINRIRMVDKDTAKRLQDLGFLNRSNAVQAAAILEDLVVQEPMILVFDNFQFCIENWQPQIFHSLAKRRRDGLQIAFLSQNFGRLRNILMDLEENICFIHSREFLLSENDIRQYAVQMEVPVSEDELHMIWMKTDGWAAAVALYLQNLHAGVIQKETEDIGDLLYDRFWRRLTVNQQEFLLGICLFDHISWSMIRDLISNLL